MYLSSGVKAECYGCRACEEVCPQKCITLVEDEEHFVYPRINRDSCVNCHLCVQTCPESYSNKEDVEDFEQEVWVGVNDSKEVQLESSSGGAFTAIYKTLIAEHYLFFGVRWDEDLQVIHDIATTEEECKRFRKSKYVMSNTNGCFSRIAALLREDHNVCFVGVPCQCAALLAFLSTKRIDRKHLFVIDLICHGAPNQYLFDRYIAEKIGTMGKKGEYSYQFKNKMPLRGIVNSRTAMLKREGYKDEILDTKTDPFMKGYYGRLFYRPSCGKCKFANSNRVSDITLGDAWHIEKEHPEWNSLTGVSCIVFNTERGLDIFCGLKRQMTLKKKSIEWVIENNMQFSKPTEMHKNRNFFFKLLKTESFEDAVNKSMRKSILTKIIQKTRTIFDSN